jgi:aryl carrier-like protein
LRQLAWRKGHPAMDFVAGAAACYLAAWYQSSTGGLTVVSMVCV